MYCNICVDNRLLREIDLRLHICLSHFAFAGTECNSYLGACEAKCNLDRSLCASLIFHALATKKDRFVTCFLCVSVCPFSATLFCSQMFLAKLPQVTYIYVFLEHYCSFLH